MKINKLLFFCLFPAALSFLSCACSTDTSASIQEVLGDSASAPVFMDCRAVSATELIFNFSMPVKVTALNFDPPLEPESVTEGREVSVRFAMPLAEGAKITADILVEDEYRNSLNVLVPLRARNDRLPKIMINELRTEYSKPRVEFVEFITLSGGNLGALRLFLAGNSVAEPAYEFPPVEVEPGEYIVLHLRAIETGWADELGDDLALSGGTDALPSARDLWVNGKEKLLRKTDAVYLVNQDEKVLDAVLLNEKPDSWWTKENFAAAAGLIAKNGEWLPLEGEAGEAYIPSPADAVQTKAVGSAATRSISRDESLETNERADNWYVTASSNATPGKANSVKRQE